MRPRRSTLFPLKRASILDLISRHHTPTTTKVPTITDKGVQDHVTKNGESLWRHAVSTQQWKHIRERITCTDAYRRDRIIVVCPCFCLSFHLVLCFLGVSSDSPPSSFATGRLLITISIHPSQQQSSHQPQPTTMTSSTNLDRSIKPTRILRSRRRPGACDGLGLFSL